MVEEGIVVEPQKVEIPLKENDRAHIPLKVIGVPFGNLIFLFNIPDEDSRLIMVLAHKEYPHCGLLSCRVKGIASEDIQTSEEIGGCFPAARTSPFAESLMQQQGEGERERPCSVSRGRAEPSQCEHRARKRAPGGLGRSQVQEHPRSSPEYLCRSRCQTRRQEFQDLETRR